MGAVQPVPAGSATRTGVWVGIATISMSFAAYTSALMVRGGAGGGSLQLDLPPILFVNTAVLLASSVTMEVGRRKLHGQVAWLIATLGLGVLFLGGQFLAWQNLRAQGFYLATTPGSSFFYVFTVLHALHLLGGIAALGYVLGRLRRDPGGSARQAVGATALYWHFMDVLWLYLLLVLTLRL